MTARQVEDPVHEVTGVSAAEILRRVAERRVGGSGRVFPRTDGRLVAPRRLLDFADGTDADFVRDAHLVLLGRPPYEAEAVRRLARLRYGGTRLELLLRLALCPEGRRAPKGVLPGVGLPALVAAGARLERVSRIPAVRRAAGAGGPGLRRLAVNTDRSRRLIRAVVMTGSVAAAAQHVRHLRTQVRALEAAAQLAKGPSA